MIQAKTILKEVNNFFFIILGLALFVFGWSAFLTPFEVTGGGVPGIGSIVFFANNHIPIGVTTFVINIILVAIAWRILGTRFCINTVICTVILSVFFWIGQIVFTRPLVDDTFMSVIIGSVLAAIGVGIILNRGGNTGGVDIIALIVGKYRNISYGQVTLYVNLLIVGSSYFIVHDIGLLVYSFVVLFVYIVVSDIVIDGHRQTYQFMVFSEENDAIANRVNKELHRGATFLKAYGSYNRQEQNVLLIVAHRTDKARVSRIIKEVDSEAFVTVSKTASVFGKNFDKIKF